MPEHPPIKEFGGLYDEHFDAIFRYVLHRVGNVAEAEDLTAQTFFKALRSFRRFRWSGGSFSSWLYRIANNEVASHFRRARPTTPMSALREEDPAVAAEAVEAEWSLTRSETHRRLGRCLRRLKPEEQTLVVLRYLEDKPFAEIAAIVKKRTGAVTMRTRRALEKLRFELEKEEADHGKAEGQAEGSEGTRRSGGPVQANVAS